MDNVEPTGFRFYRVAFSHDPETHGWCIYEQKSINGSANTLEFVDGPWALEQDASREMRRLNEAQGLNFAERPD